MKYASLGIFLIFMFFSDSFLQENSFIAKNYPNPFNPLKETTTIEYHLLKNQNVQIIIFDLGGHIVKKCRCYGGENGGKKGVNKIIWDGKNNKGELVENGVYFKINKRIKFRK